MSLILENIIKIKNELVGSYSGKSHIYEILPKHKTDFLPIDENHLSLLHEYMQNNPIYYNSIDAEICNTSCKIFEGDLNQFWINSIKHDTSYAPFYPTWMLSAYFLALESKNIGFSELIDVGSGDGRIAFCGKILGLESYSIEIDEQLSNLQSDIIKKNSINFTIMNNDATIVDFNKLNLSNPIFFIGGLPENGEMLANSIIDNILNLSKLQKKSCFVLTGTLAKRKFDKEQSDCGWNLTTQKFNLKTIKTINLPTYWTMDQPFTTPYIFTTQS
tara:strand:+ start:2744 stop:3565 length:822 start_codon:yes stop_codon:yes gene_type:complete